MELLQPGLGLLFWQAIIFLTIVFLLGKFAWKPILNSVKAREKSISDALQAAELAKQEMANLKADNEKLLQEARLERDKILAEARTAKEKMIADAKAVADNEAKRIVEQAKDEINNQKNAALAEVKTIAASLSLEIAEKVLGKQFENKTEQEQLVTNLLKDIKLN